MQVIISAQGHSSPISGIIATDGIFKTSAIQSGLFKSISQVRFSSVELVLVCLQENKFAKIEKNGAVMLLPEGFKRIDELQKNQSLNNKNAFVAMSFAENMRELREVIRIAIEKAGYIPRIMDEIEHNNQIVPEMLYEIKQSKFVIAEFTGHNNGAYYEAGYAAGLGKEVIHICRKDTFGTDGHFDVKQKATILWETETELTEALYWPGPEKTYFMLSHCLLFNTNIASFSSGVKYLL